MIKTYAAYYDNNIRNISSSGAIFSAIATRFDVVYGVAMSKDCKEAQFIRCTDDISPLLGSKYFQAKTGQIYDDVKKDLHNGLKVLFSGTGCQINALKAYLKEEYDNLFCTDIICHGVPSPLLWQKYIEYQENHLGPIHKVDFRSKHKGWKHFGMMLDSTYISKDEDPFLLMFLRDYCLRPSCYNCVAKTLKLADITLGDFWGINIVFPELNDDLGISLIIVRTKKGQDLFDQIKSSLIYKETTYETAISGNPAEYSSTIKPEERDIFYNDLSRLSFQEMITKYAKPNSTKISLHKRILRKLKKIIQGK